ncbi:hypothetical protein, partial [Parendozoicomonas sp. Alg238-R29]|uniref:hypothetical protein n=1 Tax=Parendozoicomonas sp. Alg238-R29 TaxID=2993446 RepID=UPI00248DEC7C
ALCVRVNNRERMKLIVIDTTIDDKHNFYLVEDNSSLIDWHANTFGHFYKIFSKPEEISNLIDSIDFDDNWFEVEAKAIIEKNKSVVVMSCSIEEDHFAHAIDCKAPDEAPSEFEFIIDDCSLLSGANVCKRDVYELNKVIESFSLRSSEKSISKEVFGIELYDFLIRQNVLKNSNGKFGRPNINDNPHKEALISQYLFRDHFEKSNLGVMDYWNSLHPEDRKYCRMIIGSLNIVRDEFRSEINDIEKQVNSDIPF